MRIVFMGSGDIGVPTLRFLLLESGHQVVGCVAQPDKPVGRRQELQVSAIKQLALENEVAVFQPLKVRERAAIEQIAALEPDLIVVIAYGQILPGELLRIPKLACLNLHASLLPRHRGASPIHAVIEAGDSATGMTVMYMAEGLDTGDILLQKELLIGARETTGMLHDRLAELGPVALAEALILLEQGTAPRIAQDDSLATYAAKLSRENGEIQWSASLEQIDRKIRAMTPWPGAHTFLPSVEGIKKMKVLEASPQGHRTGKPGAVIRADKQGLLVATGLGGALLLEEIQLEGKKRMRAADFLLGNPLPLETILGQP